jgi:methenyltetrahydromethanopterin cyclohydrolase
LSTSKINLNHSALALVQKLLDEPQKYGITVEKTDSGATIIDAGIKAPGGYLAGKIITEICLGGYGKAKILPIQYGDLMLSSVYVQTDQPALSTLGSQFAGWQIKSAEFSAIASGPARALALKPKSIYEEIKYKEESDIAVIVLETEKLPPKEVIQLIAEKCKVSQEKLFAVAFSTTSMAGATQVSGRIVETGLHKLTRLEFDPLEAKYAWGYAPIIPLHPKADEAMGRANDAILYAGVTNYTVDCADEEKLKSIVIQAPSSASKIIQEARMQAERSPRFMDIFKEAGFDFYKIDPLIFAPAVVTMNSMRTGKTYSAGAMDIEVLKSSLGLE